jgi:hypothetical protein
LFGQWFDGLAELFLQIEMVGEEFISWTRKKMLLRFHLRENVVFVLSKSKLQILVFSFSSVHLLAALFF